MLNKIKLMSNLLLSSLKVIMFTFMAINYAFADAADAASKPTSMAGQMIIPAILLGLM